MRKYILFILIISMLLLPGCTNNKPIRIAYVSGITGDLSDYGINGRNAFLLKVNEINDAGGINGREIEVTIYDDGNSPDNVAEIYEEIRDEGIELVVGHIISALAEPVLVEAQKGDLLIVSGTMSTVSLKGYDDYFIRTAASTDEQGKILAKVIDNDGVDSLLVVNDQRNKKYVEDISTSLTNNIKSQVEIIEYMPDSDVEEIISEKISSGNFNGVLLSLPPQEVGLISQQLKDIKPDVHLYGTSWAKDDQLIQYGGNAVEGLKIPYRTTVKSNEAAAKAFSEKYLEAFGETPLFVGELTYEMANVFFEAVENADEISVESIKSELINHTFSGLTDDVAIDQYGDRIANFDIHTVKNGEYIIIDIKEDK